MAPTQKSKKSPARSGASRSSSSAKNSRSTTTRSRQPATSSRGRQAEEISRSQRFADMVGLAFDGHGHDVWGIGLLILSIISGFGIYVGSGGPVGSAAASGIAAVVGVFKYLAPLGLAALGAVLIAGPRRRPVGQYEIDLTDGAEDEVHVSSRRTRSSRRIVGLAVMYVAVAGLVHLAVSPPSIEAGGLDAFASAGGFVGAASGGLVGQLIGTVGATVVWCLVGLLSTSLIAGLPFREMVARVRVGLGPAVGGSGRQLSGLFRVGEAPAEAPNTELFDYDADPSDPLARKPRAPRKRNVPPDAEPAVIVPEVSVAKTVEQLEIKLDPSRPGSHWKLPALTLLARSTAQRPDTEAIRSRGRKLEGALAEHGVTTRLSGMVVGPTVTRYELELGTGVKVSQVVNLSKDIAYAMASPDVRIIAPIPGKQAIGVEVPNEKRQIVALGDILCSAEAQKARSPLSVAVGRDIEGHAVMVDLAKMPHILIAGQTGAGKSSCINSIMTSVLMRATPEEVRLILVDPKRVELTQYNRVPHLLTEVVTNPKKAANALAWAVAEMERRYELLEEFGFRDIGGYNAAFDRGELEPKLGVERQLIRLPLILIVVDELADLMMVAARDVEESINRIAAKARAVGLHLVIATQRPSVNVITGVIKANIPARFAFSVASATDSKVIMNHGGAERLVGKGDMLFLDPAASSAERVQGCFVDEKEVHAVVNIWRGQASEVNYVEEVVGDANLAAVAQPGSGGGGGSAGGDEEDDELMRQAMDLVVHSQLGSTSMLQRKLKVGFARAGRIMDLLEDAGVVGPSQGSKPRDVLMSVEEFQAAQAGAAGQADHPGE